MAEAVPLLDHFYSADISDPAVINQSTPPATAASSVDDTIESCIGGGTCLSQLLPAVLITISWAFEAQQTFINVFTDAPPTWHCTGPESASSSCAALGRRPPCGLPTGSWAWDYPKDSSIISEWDLQCAGPQVVGLPASSYFAGCLAGGLLLATFADSWLGRKRMLSLSCLVMSLTAAFTAAATNIWVYVIARFVCGFARSTVGSSALVLSTELVGRRWRDRISVGSFLFFTMGFLSLPAMAYLNRGSSWRMLYIWTSVPGIFYSIYLLYFTRESPRWLLVRGRRDEAIQTLKDMASSNGKTILSSFSSLVIAEDAGSSSTDVLSTMKMLWERKWAFRRLLSAMAVGFGIGMVYYGMPLALGSLGPNIYISVALNALSEVPSSLVTLFIAEKMNRRSSCIFFAVTSGVCSMACVLMKGKVERMAVEVLSFFSACTAFNVLLVYIIELFPTCIRTSALSMVRQALVFGGVWAPMIVAAGSEHHFLSFVVFGVIIGCSGLFAVGLPETKGRPISDTIEEEELKQAQFLV